MKACDACSSAGTMVPGSPFLLCFHSSQTASRISGMHYVNENLQDSKWAFGHDQDVGCTTNFSSWNTSKIFQCCLLFLNFPYPSLVMLVKHSKATGSAIPDFTIVMVGVSTTNPHVEFVMVYGIALLTLPSGNLT